MNRLLPLSLLLSSLILATEPILTELVPTNIESAESNETVYLPYNEALEMAKKEHKIIMIKLTAEHCQYCKKMDKEVMLEKEVIATLKKSFVSVEIDVIKEKIPLDLNQTMTPTFVFVTEDEKVLLKVPGSWNKEDFLDFLNFALKKSKEENTTEEKGATL